MLFARLTDYPNYRIYINGDIYSENGNRSKYLKHHINARTNINMLLCGMKMVKSYLKSID